jgi:2'-hydroxyisoflavone reductase
VVGGGGFIGVAACKELMRRGVETIAAGRKQRPYGTFTSYVAFDRTDEEQLARALAQTEPDVLLDLACYQPQQVAAIGRRFRGRRYIFVSSGSVYPELPGMPASEESFAPQRGDPPPGDLDYAIGKQWCETLLTRMPDLPWTVIRPSAVLGPGDPTLRIAAYIQRVADRGPLLVPQETVDRPFGIAWVKDVGYGCALASDLRNDTTGKAYNVAFENVTLRNLIEGIGEAMGSTARLYAVPFDQLPDGTSPYGPDPRRYAGMDVSRARADLGYEPSALGDALAETLAWYRVARPSHPGYANRAQELEIAERD